MKKNRFLLILIVVSALFVSCDSNGVFDKYKYMDNSTWYLDEPVEFEFEIQDTLSKNNLYINIRNNEDYSFSNLFLITHLDFPNGKKIVDTLEYEMADTKGRFLGSGISEVKESKLWYKEAKVFELSGVHKISIQQAMRRNGSVEGIKELKGITDVGFRIEKIE